MALLIAIFTYYSYNYSNRQVIWFIAIEEEINKNKDSVCNVRSSFLSLRKIIYQVRWFILITWLVLAAACIPLLPKVVTVFQSTGFSVDNAKAWRRISCWRRHLVMVPINSLFSIQSNLKTSDPLFMSKVKQSLAGVKNYKYKTTIIYPLIIKNKSPKTNKVPMQ